MLENEYSLAKSASNTAVKEPVKVCENVDKSWSNGTNIGLVVVIALTWIPFPIWYALSPEGFNIIQDEAAMKISVAGAVLMTCGGLGGRYVSMGERLRGRSRLC